MNSILATATERDEKLLRVSAQMDEFEEYRAGQANRIAWITDSLGAAFNLASRDRFFLEQAALVHDIGEVLMNRHYIGLARGLSTRERIDLERHPVIGEQEVSKMGMPRGVQLIVRWHHEWWNGGGYPDALEHDQIPLAARILRVADTFCAMTANRPFRKELSVDDAKKYLREWSGIEFDPMVVKMFLSIELPPEADAATEAENPFNTGLSII